MSETVPIYKAKPYVAKQPPWNVIVHDDPVNLMGYVALVFMKVFRYNKAHATKLMLEVHQQGFSVVWTGELEKAELYVQQLQLHQLKTSLQISE
jgi:ATP-dependent Clp protease adaptor protein ClpS